MFRWLRHMRSFGDKVTALVTVISGIAIVVVSAVLAANDYRVIRAQSIAAVESQAHIVAMNSSAPLAFGDRFSAIEALAALRAAPNVAAATLFENDGADFARYRRENAPAPSQATTLPREPGLSNVDGWMVLVSPIVDRGQALGRLQVVFDLQQAYAHLWALLAVAIAVALAAMGLVYLVARQMQAVLIRPIKELARTAHFVSQTKNYAVRAVKLSQDELGEFTDTFNEMLVQIQKQDTEIQSARREAEQASQLKDEFLATLSHELRTPLTPILGWVQILRRSGAGDAQVQQAAEVIERNARTQIQIVNDLLDMSRIISGKVRLELQHVDLAEVIQAALTTVGPTADAREVRLTSMLDPELGPIRGDPARLQQIVWNLLSNAIKFTPKGGRVQISLRCDTTHARIVVADTGEGIPPAFLPHVFERFRQADSSITRQHGGLGIGLSIVRQLVELHGGRVRAESEGAGAGSTFTVELPLMSHQAAAETAPVPPGANPVEVQATVDASTTLRGTRVLLAEDDQDARAILTHMLEESGATVLALASAPEVMLALSTFRADLLISDIGMPEVDGYQLIEAIRRLPHDHGGAVPAIALTAFARSADRTRALRAGYQLHIAKPVNAAELVAAVASLVGITRATAHGEVGS